MQHFEKFITAIIFLFIYCIVTLGPALIMFYFEQKRTLKSWMNWIAGGYYFCFFMLIIWLVTE